MSSESEVQKNDSFYEIFEKHDSIMLLIEPGTGQILDANPAAVQFYGYSRERIRQMNIATINMLPPERVAAERIRALMHERNIFIFPHKLADGKLRTVEVNSSPIQWNGKQALFSIIRDITDSIRVEQALRESEDRYRDLFDRMMDGIYRSTHEGRFIDINQAMVKMFGYSSKEEMLKVDIKSELYFSPAERGSHILDNDLEQIEVYRMRRKDGSEIWVEDHGYYIHDEHGNILYHEGVLRDVTERVKAEEAYQKSEGLLNEAQRIAGIGSYVFDFNTGLWESSGILDKIFGIDASFERSVQGWGELIHPDYREEMLTYFTEDVFRRHIQFDREYRIVRYNDKSERWVHGLGDLEKDESGHLSKMRGTIQDITERKQMEESIRQNLIELEALYKVSSSVRAVNTLDEALPIIIDETLAAIDSDTGTIMLHYPEIDELRDTFPRGWFRDLVGLDIRIGEGIAGSVFASGQPYVSVEFAVDPLTKSTSRHKVPYGWGGACLPIRVASETVGVLFVAVKLPRYITPEQMRLLQSLAEIAGTTIHRTRLYDEITRRAEEFEYLYETSKALAEHVELDSLLQQIVFTAKRLLNSASSGIYLFDPKTDELVLTVDTFPYIRTGARLKMGEGAAGYVAQTRKPVRIDDYAVWAGRSKKYEGTSLSAVMEVPMLYGGDLVGVLAVDEVSNSPRKYTEADERLLSLFASQAAGAIRSARLREEAVQRLKNLQTLHEVDKAIASSLDLRITLNLLLAHVVDQLNVDASSVLLLHPYDQTLQFSAGHGFRTHAIESADVHLNDEFAGKCVMERRIVKVFDPAEVLGNQSFARLWADEEFTCYIAVPLIAKGEVKGVLEVYRRSKFILTDEWIEFLETLADQAAITIDNTQMFDNVQRTNMEMAIAYEATIEGWSRAQDLRYRGLEGHSLRVSELALGLAKAMGFHDQQLQHIRHGALLHDIGMMGVPDSILYKKGKLAEADWEKIRMHPIYALEILNPIQYLRPALDIPYCHHEKWDGTGYPRGLKGEQIPIMARLFAVVDVWDSLLTDRPYRKAWTKKKILSFIKAQKGKHFDPQIVETFLSLIKEIDN